jgi:hypothetical protein
VLLDVESFCHRVDYDLDGLVTDLQDETHRRGGNEAAAWRNSLPTFARVLSHEALKRFHLHLGHHGDAVVEYRLPASACWADVVLLGRNQAGPSVVIVELKDWDTSGDEASARAGLVRHANREGSHPSDQVKGYAEYCQRFHSAVQEDGASVSGCVFFTYASTAAPYVGDPYRSLVDEYPVFTRSRTDMADRFPAHLATKLVEPDPEFAHRFEIGSYRQDRGFVRQVAEAISNPRVSPFVLLDEQRTGFEKCMKQVERVLAPAKTSAKTKRDKKSVVIVEGPPGSGKSVVAAHLWATIGADERIDGNVVLTTTSGSQRSNWEELFERTSGQRVAGGLIVPANRYNPGLSPQWVMKERGKGRQTTVAGWRDNLERFARDTGRSRCPDNSFAVSIVDEAHALIDPTVPGKEGIPPSGWSMHAGPQAWHVIRSSRLSVFLMDSEQSYRDNETTSRASIEAFAAEFGVDQVEVVNLAGAQFRCGGSAEYMTWLGAALGLSDQYESPSVWRRGFGGPFGFEIASDPEALEEVLRPRIAEGHTARLLASYARKWVTKGEANPHGLQSTAKDFQLEFTREGEPYSWSRIWNFAPEQDYTLFVQAPEGSAMAQDSLCEVGCPYVVRGFDFDYVGVLWLSDLVWRSGHWEADPAHIHESAWKKTLKSSRDAGGRGPKADELLRRLQRGYRILLSRAIRGCYVWFEDAETRSHIESLLRGLAA